MTSPALLEELLHRRAIDRLRVDAMTIGGLTAFRPVAGRARAARIPVATHVHPEVHQHCAFGLGGVDLVEMFPPGGEFDCVHEFVLPESLDLAAPGVVRAPERPGLGLELDWDSVEAHAVRHASVES